jgi:hypothetical protein
MLIELPYQFKARDYQKEIINAYFLHSFRHLFLIIHRRAGKDLTCLQIMVAASLMRVGTYLYLLPQTNQARRVIWRGITGEGKRFLDFIPKEIIHKTNSTDMSIELVNGSIIQFGGSNNFNSYMGTNPIFIVYSEFPLHNPMARNYLSPIIRENGGSEIIQGTPRGKNHAYSLYQAAIQDEQWFCKKLTVEDTKRHDGSPVVTLEDIEHERRLGMSDELIRQEWYCDWSVGVQGAYFTREMDYLEHEKRISTFDIDRNIPVFTSWDLGVSDPTCISFWQPNNLGGFTCIYYHESTDRGVDFYARLLKELAQRFGWQYRYHFAPHDIMQREWGAGARSGMSLAHEQGIHFIRVPNLTKDDQIQSLRALLPTMRFHAEHCRLLIDALKEYRREWDEVNRVFKSKPFHNWCSHPVDSLIYGAVAWRDNFVRGDTSKPLHYSTDGFLPGQSYPSHTQQNTSGTTGAWPA